MVTVSRSSKTGILGYAALRRNVKNKYILIGDSLNTWEQTWRPKLNTVRLNMSKLRKR